jgi:pyruvate dehydrogenase E2 component (dihydrolipoyllysine-residue acetyltransferase)
MATSLTLPRLGQGMESGTIVRWLKSEGDRVEKGEPLYELDTEKVTQEVEADEGGFLLKILAGEGEEIEVGRPIAVIGAEGEEAPTPEPRPAAAAAVAEDQPREEGSPAVARSPERDRGRAAGAEAGAAAGDGRRADAGGRIKASPLARRIARERGIDLGLLTGTGPDGRIVAEDVERAAAAPPEPALAVAPGEVEVVALTQTRRTIARRLTAAWQIPVFQLGIEIDMAAATDLRRRLVERLAEGETKPTVTDILTKACAAALVRNPSLNAHFTGEEIHRYPRADIGIAAAAPEGLVVPVVRGCERRTIAQLAEARADVVGRARARQLRREDLEGGTFTISNLGMYGIDQFIAVLNPPQVAILAVGAVRERAVVDDGELDLRPLLTATLTCDHRAVDGAPAAEFLEDVKAFLEEPALML